ncbi:AAA family ATPase [Flavobacterium orientale]|uniref:Protein CR006 P-loop domain-containing protein n=1 Tax=Flavobacterium orientale TaxID=1756020 RepID=A0A916XWT9_9FLAO|nr:AAA family ATPase [Flavobacterium orientale]GGD17691.1 hypothetical protein GCM10011343_05510 [Flavobacterium orientale]
MIEKIEEIKDFGIYKDFNWVTSPNIKDFNLKNIFYGWNYSGKTTLSRIFSSLRDKKLPESYQNGSFKIKTKEGSFSSNNLDNFPYDILVFNSDYIYENLNFSTHKDSTSDSKTILFEVGDNAKYEAKVIQLKSQIESINGSETLKGKKFNFLKSIDEFEVYDRANSGHFTVLAKKILNEDFLSLITFTKTQLKPIVNYVKKDVESFIIKDKKQLSSLSEIVKTSNPKDKIEEIKFFHSYSEIIEKTNQILTKIPDNELINKLLDGNIETYTWVKDGQNFHKPNSKCLFCDNIITKERIDFLKDYFNNEASILKENANILKKMIFQEEQNINLINIPSSFNDFNLGFTENFKILNKQFSKSLFAYKKHLKFLLVKIDEKINKSLYFDVGKVNELKIEEIEKTVKNLNELIKKNNNFSENFNIEIDSKRDKFKNHLVASFLKREKYLLKEKKYNKAIVEIEKLNLKVKKYEDLIFWNESRKRSDKEGALQYSSFIQDFLCRADIEIKLDDKTNKFKLMRDNENASNLSEGEKTAIAFSHFLVTIKSLESIGKFKDYVVFIDDPMSSLDSNHVFQINSFIKEFFFGKGPNPDPKQKALLNIVKCKQLFISTHSFEFFNLLKELPISKNSESRYFISRIKNIENLPNVYNSFESEYQFLFNEIITFNNDPNKNNSPKFLMMPNILRRFTEIYTLTKYPSGEPLESRADKVFNKVKSKRILKAFHYFSHLDNIDRIGKQSEFLADIPIACSTLVEFIKTEDRNHFEALNKAIN